jgi:hypothetical protein
MCRDCQQCQRGKVHKQPAASLHTIPVPARKFFHIHVDLVGPLPASSDSQVYLLTAPLTGQQGECKLSLFATWRPARAQTPSLPTGWLVLACQPQSQLTEVHSSLLLCGQVLAQARASSTFSQWPTTLRGMEWCSACSGRSRIPYMHVVRDPRGTLTFPGC